MSKNVFISILEKDESRGKELFTTVTRYGLGASGHFWSDNLEKMEWAGPVPELEKPDTGVWLIRGTSGSYANPDIRFGLSLLAVSVQARRGHGFPILCICDDGDLDGTTLPTPLRSAEVVQKEKLGAKLAAKANIPVKNIDSGYRLDLHALPGLGLWAEIGPGPNSSWQGALFGVSGGEITAHGVGSSGQLPERCVLNYPMKGLGLEMAEQEYLGWGVKNELGEKESYFVKIEGAPDNLLFGELPAGENTDLFSLAIR